MSVDAVAPIGEGARRGVARPASGGFVGLQHRRRGEDGRRHGARVRPVGALEVPRGVAGAGGPYRVSSTLASADGTATQLVTPSLSQTSMRSGVSPGSSGEVSEPNQGLLLKYMPLTSTVSPGAAVVDDRVRVGSAGFELGRGDGAAGFSTPKSTRCRAGYDSALNSTRPDSSVAALQAGSRGFEPHRLHRWSGASRRGAPDPPVRLIELARPLAQPGWRSRRRRRRTGGRRRRGRRRVRRRARRSRRRRPATRGGRRSTGRRRRRRPGPRVSAGTSRCRVDW